MTEYRGIDASVAKILLRPITQSTQEEYLEQYREQEMSKDLGEWTIICQMISLCNRIDILQEVMLQSNIQIFQECMILLGIAN